MISDPTLVARIRDGDVSAFEVLFTQYFTPLVGFAESIVHSPDAACDVVHDVFVRIWTQRTTWTPERGIAPYLFGAVRNAALSVQRDTRTSQDITTNLAAIGDTPALAAPPPDGLTATSVAERARLLNTALQQLAPRRRQVILLRWTAGMRSKDIADTLGITIRAVENLHLRAIEDLRELLGDRFP